MFKIRISRIRIAIVSLCWVFSAIVPVSQAVSGVPDLGLSFYWWNNSGPEPIALLVSPDGNGASFTQATSSDGQVVDATIYLTVLDGSGTPVAHFPSEDMWLEWEDGGVVLCTGGTIADQNTDATGTTYWTAPLRAGGSSQSPCHVYLMGTVVVSAGGLPLHANSPDMNGDLQVNLMDVPVFASDFISGYSFRSDLRADGVINLSDVTVLAQAFGAACP